MATYKRCVLLLTVFLTGLVFAAEPNGPDPNSAPRRDPNEIKAVLDKAPKPAPTEKLGALEIVLIAGPKDHGRREHDYPWWQKKWQKMLNGSEMMWIAVYPPPPLAQAIGNIKVTTAWEWPSKEQLEKADLIVMYTWGRWNEQKLQELEGYLKRGGGFVSVHPALITDKSFSKRLANMIGYAWENKYTTYRYGPMELKLVAPGHPVAHGLPESIDFVDEAYWPLVKGDPNNLIVLATSDEKNVNDPNKVKAEPMFWTYRYGRGRVFGCILGHYTWTFDDPYFQILLLRGMAWAAAEPVSRFDPVVLAELGKK